MVNTLIVKETLLEYCMNTNKLYCQTQDSVTVCNSSCLHPINVEYIIWMTLQLVPVMLIKFLSINYKCIMQTLLVCSGYIKYVIWHCNILNMNTDTSNCIDLVCLILQCDTQTWEATQISMLIEEVIIIPVLDYNHSIWICHNLMQ